MRDIEKWDWETSEKEILVNKWINDYNWIEEIKVSQDGENIASIVSTGEAEFGICVNGELWDESFEKAWSLQFTPSQKLVSLVSNDEEWAVCIDGNSWESKFDYIWDLKVNSKGVGASVQVDGKYGMVVNGIAWGDLFENISGTVLNENGDSAAVVQVDPISQADIERYNNGIYSVSVNGILASEKHTNIWDISFNSTGSEVAYSIRKNRTDYSIGRNKSIWDNTFQCSWKPVFTNNNEVIAPVRKGGKWYLYKDDKQLWKNNYLQLLNLAVSGDNISVAISDSYGKWSVSENDIKWDFRCDKIISDLFYSDSGKTLIALFKNNKYWDIAVNNKIWGLKADKLWKPHISDNEEIITTRMEKDGKYYLVVNGNVHNEGFEMIFEPEISSDSSKILLKVLDMGVYKRKILPLDQLL
ncbi:MAG: Tmc redox complex protein TmcD [Desulfobacterales bacterium]|nr:Tmc redox complex protein TmcD [Desulfobacterales bacterium]